jgi:hypothetical protein
MISLRSLIVVIVFIDGLVSVLVWVILTHVISYGFDVGIIGVVSVIICVVQLCWPILVC